MSHNASSPTHSASGQQRNSPGNASRYRSKEFILKTCVLRYCNNNCSCCCYCWRSLSFISIVQGSWTQQWGIVRRPHCWLTTTGGSICSYDLVCSSWPAAGTCEPGVDIETYSASIYAKPSQHCSIYKWVFKVSRSRAVLCNKNKHLDASLHLVPWNDRSQHRKTECFADRQLRVTRPSSSSLAPPTISAEFIWLPWLWTKLN